MNKNILTLLAILFLVILVSYSRSDASDCPIEELLLPETAFPLGTYSEKVMSPVPELPRKSASRQFHYQLNATYHQVIDWDAETAVGEEYTKGLRIRFDENEFQGPWEIPDTLIIPNTQATNYHVGCSLAHGFYQCRMIATYGQYSVFLRSYISDQGITIEHFGKFLETVDQIMESCISK